MPGTTDPTTQIMLNAEPLLQFLPLVTPINHSILYEQKKLKAPLTEALREKLPPVEMRAAEAMDILLRTPAFKHEFEYSGIMLYLNVIMLNTLILIDHYHDPEFQYAKNPQLFLNNATQTGSQLYIGGYVAMLRCKLDMQFDYIKALVKKCHPSDLFKGHHYKFANAITTAYRDISDTVDEAAQFMATHQEVIDAALAPEVRFEFYQQHIETLMFGMQFPIILTSAKYRHKITTSLAKLDEIDKQMNDASHHLTLLMLKAKIEFHIFRKEKRAIQLVLEAKTELHRLALFNDDFSDASLHYFNNHVNLLHLSLYMPQFKTTNQHITYTLLHDMLDIILEAKESIHLAPSDLIGQWDEALDIVIKSSLYKLIREIENASLENLDTLKKFTLKLEQAAQLLSNQPMAQTVTDVQLSTIGHKRLIFSVIKNIEKHETIRREQAQENEIKFAALAKEEADYNKKFEETLKQFDKEARQEIIRKPKIISPKPMKLPAPQIIVAVNTPAEAARVPLTLAQYAQHYFSTRPPLHDIESLLDSVHDDDIAEAMLYIGDEYLIHNQMHNALVMYEKAIMQTQLQLTSHPELVNAISMQVEYTRTRIQKQLEASIAHEKHLLASRERFIMELGIAKLTQKGAPAKDRDPENPACHDNIYQHGEEEFRQMGIRKRERGEPVSYLTQNRLDHKAFQKECKQSLVKAKNILMLANANSATADPFPPLSANTATLFQAPKNKAPRQQHAQKKRRGKHK